MAVAFAESLFFSCQHLAFYREDRRLVTLYQLLPFGFYLTTLGRRRWPVDHSYPRWLVVKAYLSVKFFTQLPDKQLLHLGHELHVIVLKKRHCVFRAVMRKAGETVFIQHSFILNISDMRNIVLYRGRKTKMGSSAYEFTWRIRFRKAAFDFVFVNGQSYTNQCSSRFSKLLRCRVVCQLVIVAVRRGIATFTTLLNKVFASVVDMQMCPHFLFSLRDFCLTLEKQYFLTSFPVCCNVLPERVSVSVKIRENLNLLSGVI